MISSTSFAPRGAGGDGGSGGGGGGGGDGGGGDGDGGGTCETMYAGGLLQGVVDFAGLL